MVSPEELAEFRGGVRAELRSLHERMDRFERSCNGCQQNVHLKMAELGERIEAVAVDLVQLRIRVAWYAGVGAVAGAIGGAVITALVGRIVG